MGNGFRSAQVVIKREAVLCQWPRVARPSDTENHEREIESNVALSHRPLLHRTTH